MYTMAVYPRKLCVVVPEQKIEVSTTEYCKRTLLQRWGKGEEAGKCFQTELSTFLPVVMHITYSKEGNQKK